MPATRHIVNIIVTFRRHKKNSNNYKYNNLMALYPGQMPSVHLSFDAVGWAAGRASGP